MSIRIGAYDALGILDMYKATISGPWDTTGYDVQYRIESDGSKKIVSFQGTVEDIDIYLDIAAWHKAYKRSPDPWYAHAGFLMGYKSAQNVIKKQLEGAGCVEVRGYSLGSAYASLLHEDIKFSFPGLPVTTYAFGTPRFAHRIPQTVKDRFSGVYRINTYGDPVNNPFPLAFIGYRHIGDGTFIGPKNHLPLVKHHLYPYYIQALEGLCQS